MGSAAQVLKVAVMVLGAGMLAEGAFQPEAPPPPGCPSPAPLAPERQGLERRLEAQQATIARLELALATALRDPEREQAEALGILQAVQRLRPSDPQAPRLAKVIVRTAQRHQLDPQLVTAVIQIESRFDRFAVSSEGALGLMQVMPQTGRLLLAQRGESLKNPHRLFDEELNIDLGASYLADMIHRFGSVEKALVAYNAGPGLARKILADSAWKARFLAKYPANVLREFDRLKQAAAAQPKPQAAEAAPPGSTAG